MLNTSKLLYILPDLAYIAELLPGKKEHQFHIQSFRQINGEFVDDNLLIPANIKKLVEKIDEEDYHLILPDFLFTNTIVEILETNKTKVEKYLKETLLPQLNLSDETHQISHFILTSYNNKSKVQITALEKSILEPFRDAAKNKKIKITGVSPLSWTVKSVISLEPSISVVQIGSILYLSLHYIGLDQTISFDIEKVENIVESIKTLKGGEPSIQTVYLLTNQLIEDKLKELLSDTIPLQQLASFAEDDKELPSYVKQVIEMGMKTLSITDYMTPEFKLGKAGETAMPEGKADAEDEDAKTQDDESKDDNVKTQDSASSSDDIDTEVEEVEPIPAPTLPVIGDDDETVKTQDATSPSEDESVEAKEVEDKTMEKESVTANDQDKNTEKDLETKEDDTKKDHQADTDKEVKTLDLPSPTEKDETNEKPLTEIPMKEDQKMINPTSQETEIDLEPDLHQFAAHKETDTIALETTPLDTNTKREVIKNNNPSKIMLRMIFVTLAVLFVTVGVGVGLGLGFLTLSNKTDQPDTTPIVEVSEAPEAEVEPSPSPSPTPEPIDKTAYDILVVNATTTAGKAGKIKTTLEENDFENIDAGNAEGDYDDGTYILMNEKNENLISELETALDTTLTYSNEVTVEDPDGDYDFVIVLAE